MTSPSLRIHTAWLPHTRDNERWLISAALLMDSKTPVARSGLSGTVHPKFNYLIKSDGHCEHMK